jgi:dTDP-4-dehydrorhamnose reductase
MINLSRDKDELNVVNDEISSFTYTTDLARATKSLIESDQGCGIYHITNSGQASWYDGAVELFKQARINIKVKPISSKDLPRPAKRPKYSSLKNTKLEPLRFWKEALREYLINNKI